MKHLTEQQIELYVRETGIEYRLDAHEGQYDLYIVQSSADHFELSIEEWGDTVHDSVPFTSLLEALQAADEMITELEGLNKGNYDSHIAALEKARDKALDQQEEERAERNPDTGHFYDENWDATVNLDTEHARRYDGTNSQADSAFDERGFLLDIVDAPLPAMFEKHLKPGAAAAFEMFRREGFVELAVNGDLWCVTNKGRERLGMGADTAL